VFEAEFRGDTNNLDASSKQQSDRGKTNAPDNQVPLTSFPIRLKSQLLATAPFPVPVLRESRIVSWPPLPCDRQPTFPNTLSIAPLSDRLRWRPLRSRLRPNPTPQTRCHPARFPPADPARRGCSGRWRQFADRRCRFAVDHFRPPGSSPRRRDRATARRPCRRGGRVNSCSRGGRDSSHRSDNEIRPQGFSPP